MRLAERMSRLGTESAFEVLARAKALEAQGRDIIHLEFGEPDFPTPENITEAGIRALREGKTKYTPSAGIPELREAIAKQVTQTRGVTVTPAQVVITPGAKPIMFFSILALVDAGDEVLCPDPGFPIYASMINFCGGKPVPYLLREENNFRFDLEEFCSKVTAKTRLIILNSPHNPTGGALERSDLEVVASIAQKFDIMILSDEIYWQLLYDGESVSPLSLPEMLKRVILLDGCSKTYAMTGWRIGWGVIPSHLEEHITRLQVNANSCVASFTQYAALEALMGSQGSVSDMLMTFKERRDVIVEGLNAIPGFKCLKPRGAFYAFPNITGTGWDSRRLADFLLKEAGVACLSGTAFGAAGEGYLRFSYANSLENIERALVRIRNVIAKIMD